MSVSRTSVVNDVYQLGHLGYETDGSGTILASFTYDSSGVPTSVVVGSDPTNTADRYYYVYNGHGDTVGWVDSNGSTVTSYSYDTWGNLTSDTESVGGAVQPDEGSAQPLLEEGVRSPYAQLSLLLGAASVVPDGEQSP